MTHLQAVITPGPDSRPLAGGKDDDPALLGRDRLSTRLRPWPLLDKEELAAGIIDLTPTQETGQLQGKGDLPVEVLMQAIIAPCLIAQQQGGRFGLPMLLAERQEARKVGWVT